MKVGDKYTHPVRFTQAQVETFAQVTGDDNPLHLDAEYAATTPFKRPIVHGFLAGSVFSKVFGTIWPGKGTIYLKQQMVFKRPLYVETDYVASFEVIDCHESRSRVTIRTLVLDQDGKEQVSGEALLQGGPKE